ncbi:MAG: hypothetical protein JRI68_18165 [Deltaproteobacteria bacterium]|nr:hypothetical protein [Deltaproteobacteria bacterium]
MNRALAILQWTTLGAAILGLVANGSGGCAAGDSPDSDDDYGASSSGSGGSTTSGTGGTASGVGGGGGNGGSSSPCETDCTQIQAPACQVAQCNAQTGQCEVVADEDDTPCDDGLFCTVEDSCAAGICTGGPDNDCGLSPAPCEDITCDEQAQSCAAVAKQNGESCTDPNDLCLENTSCVNGLCQGTPKDCFMQPVPDDCHVSECNPQNGQCEPVPGNEGDPCVDINDLCTVQKTCASGVCQGGSPMNCSQLTQGCVLGVCDPNTGQCTTQNLNNGDPCDDLDGCTLGETCQNGGCSGGTPVTVCQNGDNCCPSNCTAQNDLECACTTENLVTSYTSNNGFHGNMFDIVALNAVEILGFDANLNSGAHTMEVHYRVGSFVGHESSATGWTLIGTGTTNSTGTEVPTPVNVAVNVSIPQGQTYGFYVTTQGTSNRYINGTSVGTVFASDPNIQVLEGVGKSYPFGSTNTTRVFSGTVHYEVCGS